MNRREYITGLNKIPEELRTLDQWTVHVNKIPHNPLTGKLAKANDPTTWVSFDEACTAYLRDFGTGLSFAFSEYDPYCGIDFDHCVEDGKCDPAKREIILSLNSYSELSQSETGVHVFVRAALGSGRKSTKHGIEIYDRNRFFAMTGKRLAINHDIAERQTEIDELLDKYFPKPVEMPISVVQARPTATDQEIIEKMCKWNYKASKLWRGDLSDVPRKPNGDPDMSSADLSLLNCIAYWSKNDMSTMERVFTKWCFFRPGKWRKKATATMTYGQLTMSRAMSKAVYKG